MRGQGVILFIKNKYYLMLKENAILCDYSQNKESKIFILICIVRINKTIKTQFLNLVKIGSTINVVDQTVGNLPEVKPSLE